VELINAKRTERRQSRRGASGRAVLEPRFPFARSILAAPRRQKVQRFPILAAPGISPRSAMARTVFAGNPTIWIARSIMTRSDGVRFIKFFSD
jgi:hypothetical protein